MQPVQSCLLTGTVPEVFAVSGTPSGFFDLSGESAMLIECLACVLERPPCLLSMLPPEPIASSCKGVSQCERWVSGILNLTLPLVSAGDFVSGCPDEGRGLRIVLSVCTFLTSAPSSELASAFVGLDSSSLKTFAVRFCPPSSFSSDCSDFSSDFSSSTFSSFCCSCFVSVLASSVGPDSSSLGSSSCASPSSSFSSFSISCGSCSPSSSWSPW